MQIQLLAYLTEVAPAGLLQRLNPLLAFLDPLSHLDNGHLHFFHVILELLRAVAPAATDLTPIIVIVSLIVLVPATVAAVRFAVISVTLRGAFILCKGFLKLALEVCRDGLENAGAS